MNKSLCLLPLLALSCSPEPATAQAPNYTLSFSGTISAGHKPQPAVIGTTTLKTLFDKGQWSVLAIGYGGSTLQEGNQPGSMLGGFGGGIAWQVPVKELHGVFMAFLWGGQGFTSGIAGTSYAGGIGVGIVAKR